MQYNTKKRQAVQSKSGRTSGLKSTSTNKADQGRQIDKVQISKDTNKRNMYVRSISSYLYY